MGPEGACEGVWGLREPKTRTKHREKLQNVTIQQKILIKKYKKKVRNPVVCWVSNFFKKCRVNLNSKSDFQAVTTTRTKHREKLPNVTFQLMRKA